MPLAPAFLEDVNWLVEQGCVARKMTDSYSAPFRKDLNSYATIYVGVTEAIDRSGGITPGVSNPGEQVIAINQMLVEEWPQEPNPDKAEAVRRMLICSEYERLLSECGRSLQPPLREEYSWRSTAESKRYTETLGPEYFKDPNWPDTPNEDFKRMIAAQGTGYTPANRQSGSSRDAEEFLIPMTISPVHALPLDQLNKPKRLLSKDDVDRYIEDRPEAVAAEGKTFMAKGKESTSDHWEILKVHEIVQSGGEKYVYLSFHDTGEDAIRYEWGSFKDFLKPGGLDAEVLLLARIQTLSSYAAAAGADFLQDNDSHTSESIQPRGTGWRRTPGDLSRLDTHLPSQFINTSRAEMSDEDPGAPFVMRACALRIQEEHPMRELTAEETLNYAEHPEVALGKTFKASGVDLIGDGRKEESIFRVHYLVQDKDGRYIYLGYPDSGVDAVHESLESFQEMLRGATQVWEYDGKRSYAVSNLLPALWQSSPPDLGPMHTAFPNPASSTQIQFSGDVDPLT
ncbi:hypothetical protein NMY22_g1912 [Coprinellus aureogranulatus]|nr:hypothetical protein NMY22_g1912 [Coprinellus aureogranulatus]